MKKIYFITPIFILFSILSFSQVNKNIETQMRIEDLTTEINKLNEDLAELDSKKNIFEEILLNVSSDSITDLTTITNDINTLKKLSLKDADKIVPLINSIESYKINFMYNLQNVIYSYQSNNSNFAELIMLGNRLNQIKGSNLANYYSYGDDYKIVLNEDAVKGYMQSVNVELVKNERTSKINEVRNIIKEYLKSIESKYTEIKTKIDNAKEEKLIAQSEIESKADYDNSIFRWGFPVFILFILLLYLLPLWFVYRKQTDGDKLLSLYKSIYGSGLLLEIITVFLLTSTILLLGITDKLSPEILGTLIGGISGYVLGRSFNGLKGNKKESGAGEDETKIK